MPIDNRRAWADSDGTWHEDYRVEVYVEGEHLGGFTYDTGAYPELGWRRSGVSYYCPYCAKVWAQVLYFNANGAQQSADVETVSCRNHRIPSFFWNVPGSIFGIRDRGFIVIAHLFPVRVLRRELQMIHDYRKGSNDVNQILPASRPNQLAA